MSRRGNRSVILASIAVALAAGGCGNAPEGVSPEARQEAPVGKAADVSGARIDALGTADLRTRATGALRERRVHAPAGDNAIEYYLALRDKAPADASVAAALVELQPYLLIAAEQALARDEIDEAGRLLALMDRIDPDAPALPRLRDALRTAGRALADAGARARAAQAAREPVPLPAPDGVPPSAAAGQVARIAAPIPEPEAEVPDVATAVTLPGTVPATAPVIAPVVERPASPPPAAASRPAPRVPRLVRDAPPRYPMIAMSRRIEGRVRVGFTIEPDGSVSSVKLLSADPAGVFDDAAIEAARRWRFEPGERSVTTTRTLNFALPRGG